MAKHWIGAPVTKAAELEAIGAAVAEGPRFDDAEVRAVFWVLATMPEMLRAAFVRALGKPRE